MKKLIITSMMLLSAVLSASAVDVVRKDINTNSIATTITAWSNSVVPGASDVAVWNGTINSTTATNNLGASTSWQGIRVGPASSRAVTLNAQGTEILTLGSAGIDMTSAPQNFTIRTKVDLGASQTWAVTNTKVLAVNGVISGASDKVLTKNGSGTLTLGGTNTYSGGTVLNAGILNITAKESLGSGTLTINGGTLDNSLNNYITNANAMVINNDFDINFIGNRGLWMGGNVSLGTSNGASRTVSVSGNTAAQASFLGSISDGTSASQLIKSGSGVLALYGTNTHSGGTALNGGTLLLNNSASLGSGVFTINGGIIANSGSLYPTVTVVNAGTVINSNFSVNAVSGSSRIINLGTGPVSLGSAGTSRTITQAGSSAFIVGGDISDGTGGSKKLILNSTATGFIGRVYLNGSNSYSGGTVINMVDVTTTNRYGLGSGGLNIYNDSLTYASKLTLANSLTLNGALSSGASSSTNFTGVDVGNYTLTLNQNDDSTYGQGIMGNGGLIKSGLGTLKLSGTNTYLGATTVSGGKLIVNSFYNNSKITVQNGGTLGGTGALKAVTLDAGAILAPGDGNSPGTMLFNGTVLLSPGSTNIVAFLASGFGALRDSAGTNRLTLAGANIFDFSGNTVTNGSTFAVFQNWGAISNSGASFTGINMTAGQSVVVDTTGGIGVLTVIPEPATIGMLGLGAIITVLIRRIRS